MDSWSNGKTSRLRREKWRFESSRVHHVEIEIGGIEFKSADSLSIVLVGFRDCSRNKKRA